MLMNIKIYYSLYTLPFNTVEPKVYVSASSTVLIDGGNKTLVATCVAEGARPPAEVSWESNLIGQSEVQLIDEVNGTTTTQVRYLWQPTRNFQGHAVTCVIRHPALQSDFRIPYLLNVQCECHWVSVTGCDIRHVCQVIGISMLVT